MNRLVLKFDVLLGKYFNSMAFVRTLICIIFLWMSCISCVTPENMTHDDCFVTPEDLTSYYCFDCETSIKVGEHK